MIQQLFASDDIAMDFHLRRAGMTIERKACLIRQFVLGVNFVKVKNNHKDMMSMA